MEHHDESRLRTERRRYVREHPDMLAGLPTWIKAIALVGIPGAIALFLVWMGANELPKLVRQVEDLRIQQNDIRQLLQEHLQESASTYRLLQRICVNAADDLAERERCFEN